LIVRRRHFVLSALAGATAACSRAPEAATATAPAAAPDGATAGQPESTPAPPPKDGVVVVGGAELTVLIEGSNPSLPRSTYEAWVRRSAEMITAYYDGTFPVPSLEVKLVTTGRGSVGYGHHQQGRWVTIYCGRRTRESSLQSDWVMVHEMLHATFPDLPNQYNWMQEGLSTYLEKIVRARAGAYDEQQVWRGFAKSMHHGRPRAGDRGLDVTRTWGRLYWGGALFWMVADVELRKATDNRKSLRDALLHIASIGGNAREMWTTRRVCAEADAGTGTTVVSDLYKRMALAPGDVDLDRLWAELGVVRVGRSVEFDDTAPLAEIRRGICAS